MNLAGTLFSRIKRIGIIKEKVKIAQKHYDDVLKRIRGSGRTSLSFAAYVVYDSTYGLDGAFMLMKSDPSHWNPKIVVIPDISRGDDHARQTYLMTRKFFVEHYGHECVLDGWDPDTGEFYDHLDDFDIVYYANPYDPMVHEYHRIEYSLNKDVLPIYVSYGYDVGLITTVSRLTNPEINLVWKYFVDTVYSYEDCRRFQIIRGRNAVLAGYSKMDRLADYKLVFNTKKKILITPHHTVTRKELPLSNFLEYYDLLPELPDLFPDVDFVFRPHPLLFSTLVSDNIWTQDQVDEYVQTLQDKNIVYSKGGDYMDLFAGCDAIINDCGSFAVEWLYTGKPGCFVHNKGLKKIHMTKLMRKAIEGYAIARTREDIIDFIKSVINDDRREVPQMEKWVSDNIALNFPDVSGIIVNEIDILKQNTN